MSEVEITVEALDNNGCGIHKKGNKILLIENSLPGDIVKVSFPSRLRQKKTKLYINGVVSQKIPRIPQTCYYAISCGGCKFQDIDYSEQLKLKFDKVVHSFATLSEIPLPEIKPIISAPSVFYYRNKMEFTFSHKRWLTAEEVKENKEYKKDFALGMHTPYTYDKIIDLDECYLQTKQTPEIMNWFREFCLSENWSAYNTNTNEGYLRFLVIRESTYSGETMINLITRTKDTEKMEKLGEALKKQFPSITSFYNSIYSKLGQVATAEELNLVFGSSTISDQILGLKFEISPFSFFQPNTKAAEIVYKNLIELANFSGQETVLDLYCGVGSIALTIADKVKKVFGFELVEEAVQAAERNRQINNISNCEFFAGDLKDVVNTHAAFTHEKIDTIIVDPPRGGLHPNVIERILKLNIKTILYVSCNPVSQAANLQALCHNNAYHITAIQPIDMLPNTYHVENIVKLERKT